MRASEETIVKGWFVALACGAFEYVVLLLLLDDSRTLTYVFTVSLATYFVADAAASIRIDELTARRLKSLSIAVQGFLISFLLFSAVVVIASVRYLQPERFVANLEYVLAFLVAIVVVVLKTYLRKRN